MAHDYANVDLNIVWQVATAHVPEVCATLEAPYSETLFTLIGKRYILK